MIKVCVAFNSINSTFTSQTFLSILFACQQSLQAPEHLKFFFLYIRYIYTFIYIFSLQLSCKLVMAERNLTIYANGICDKKCENKKVILFVEVEKEWCLAAKEM